MFGGSFGNLIMGLHVQSKQQMDAAERRAAELCLGAGLTNDYRGEVMATTINEVERNNIGKSQTVTQG